MADETETPDNKTSEQKLADLEARVLAGETRAVDKQHGEGKLTARERIDRLADPGSFTEDFMLAETQCTDFCMAERRQPTDGVVCGFARIGGVVVGLVGNQPSVRAGTLDIDASDKGARFIRFCNCFNIPIVTLMDVPGFFPGRQQEEQGIIRHGAKMLYAYAEATVPKITIVLRKGYGGAKQAMCTREMGADQLWLWPGVELAVMGGGGAVNVLFRREIAASDDPERTRREKMAEFNERFNGPFEALSKQFSQTAIQPADTRARLIPALALLRRKKETRPAKKHGVMPV